MRTSVSGRLLASLCRIHVENGISVCGVNLREVVQGSGVHFSNPYEELAAADRLRKAGLVRVTSDRSEKSVKSSYDWIEITPRGAARAEKEMEPGAFQEFKNIYDIGERFRRRPGASLRS